MEPQFNVVFTGELAADVEREAFIQAFSERFKCGEAKAAEVHDAGKPITMKTAVPLAVAEEFKKVLELLGMTIRLDPVTTADEAAPATADAAAAEPPANPYQAPKANLQPEAELGEMSGPVSVPFGHGSRWIGSAYRDHFRGNALAWIGAFFLFSILNIVMQLIPLLGFFVSAMLSPVLTAGLMLGARAQEEGEAFTVGHLFAGFKSGTGQLMLVGVFYLIGTIVLMLVMVATMGGTAALFSMGEPGSAQPMQAPAAMLLPMLVMMLLFIPLMMAYWFAPALVAINKLPALTAMKLSFSGCLKNVLPFTLYGILMLVLLFIAAIPFGLGLLVMLPIMMASMYTAYRDIYYSAG